MIGGEAVTAMSTPRLRLGTFRAADLPHLAAMNANPVIMRFLGGPVMPEALLAMADATQRAFLAEGFGIIVVEPREDGALLEVAGLSRLAWHPDDLRAGCPRAGARPGSPTPFAGAGQGA